MTHDLAYDRDHLRLKAGHAAADLIRRLESQGVVLGQPGDLEILRSWVSFTLALAFHAGFTQGSFRAAQENQDVCRCPKQADTEHAR